MDGSKANVQLALEEPRCKLRTEPLSVQQEESSLPLESFRLMPSCNRCMSPTSRLFLLPVNGQKTGFSCSLASTYSSFSKLMVKRTSS